MPRVRCLVPVTGLLLLLPALVAAQCGVELTATVLVSGIHPGSNLVITTVSVTPTAATTRPPEAQLLAAVQSVYAGEPWLVPGQHRLSATVGNFSLYIHEPGDFGAATLVDRRNAQVPFAGTVVWMGTGAPVVPALSSYDWTLVPGDPAPPPSVAVTMPSWWGESWSTEAQLLEDTLALVRHSDLLHAFAACGDYSVLGYVYTPAVGTINPVAAIEVLVISGHAVNWPPVAVEPSSWGRVKGLYR